jgi:putative ABC transport system permease protein
MNLLESIQMATNTLMANKMRSCLTMLGIIIGNASTIATIGVGEGAQDFVTAEIQSLGPNVLFVRPGSPEADRRPVFPPQTLVYEDAEAIAAQVPTVRAVAPELNSSEAILYRGNTLSATIIGTVPSYLNVRSFDVARGRFLSNLDLERNTRVAALGTEVAEQLFGKADPVGATIRIRNVSFQVVGVMQPKGSSFGMNMDRTVFIPLTTMASQLVGRTSPYGTNVTFISVSAVDEASVPAAQFQIENLLRLRHKIVDEDDFTVRSQEELQNTLGSITGTLKILLAAVASISLVVGGIGIMNIMLVSVTERTQEIGLRKAVGAAPTDILMQFTIEAIILSVAGGLVGTAIGAGSIWLLGLATPLQATVSTSAVVLAVSVSGGIGLFFGIVPARQAAKLDPIVALRSA